MIGTAELQRRGARTDHGLADVGQLQGGDDVTKVRSCSRSIADRSRGAAAGAGDACARHGPVGAGEIDVGALSGSAEPRIATRSRPISRAPCRGARCDARIRPRRDAVQLQYTTITAPISGRTGALIVHEGNLVRANDATALVVINHWHPLRVLWHPRRTAAGTETLYGAGHRSRRGCGAEKRRHRPGALPLSTTPSIRRPARSE